MTVGDAATIETTDAPTTLTQPPTVTIAASGRWALPDLAAVWEYRELLYFLVWREVQGRYRQMAFGPLWIIIQPLVQMVIFTLVFGQIARLPSDGIPYPIFTYVALLPWQFFANALRLSANSLVTQKHIIAKVYFPRLVIPITAVISSLVDFMASFVVLLGMMLVYGVTPSWAMLTLPLFLLLAGVTALGVGLWLAGLAVKYHDVAIAVGFGVTIWQYLTPVAYSASLVPESWRWLYQLNPMYSVIEGFRWAILGQGYLDGAALVVSSVAVVVVLVIGAYVFRSTERTIVDVI